MRSKGGGAVFSAFNEGIAEYRPLRRIILTSLLVYVIIVTIEQDESPMVDAVGIKDISVSVCKANMVDAMGVLSGDLYGSGSIYIFVYLILVFFKPFICL